MKFDAILSVGGTYVGGLYAAALAQFAAGAVAQGPAQESIFWWSFCGAGLAALFTVAPAFDPANSEPPRAVAFRGFVTLTAGFLFSFAGSDWLNHASWGGVGPLALPPAFMAVLCGLAGEKILSGAFHAKPADWWRWLTSLKPGGGR